MSREHAHLPKIVMPAPSVPEWAPATSAAEPANDAKSAAPRMSSRGVAAEASEPTSAAESPLPRPQTRAQRIQQDRRQRRLARYEEIVTLHRQGSSIRSIAQQMGMGRHTVRRYLATGSFPEITPRRPMPSLLDPFEPYLRQRWDAGGHNAMQLYREIRDLGYTGSRPLLSRWAAQQRRRLPNPGAPDGARTTQHALHQASRQLETRRKLSPSQAAWLLVCKPDALRVEQSAALEQMLQGSVEIALAYDLAQEFASMVRDRKAEPLTSWLEAAKKSCLTELRSFAHGIERDLAAVRAGLTLPWSQGQVEGQVNRLKLVKRSGYGRAGFELLKHRVLAPT